MVGDMKASGATIVPSSMGHDAPRYKQEPAALGCGGCRLFWRQFFALARKNFLIKRRTPWQLIVELIVPPIFLLLIGAIKAAIDPSTFPEFLPSQDTPIASFGMMEEFATPPNILCFDNNLLHRCWCTNEELGEEVDIYMTGGTLSDTGQVS
ncbi:unnamed protein product [Discosporangium mesarthrocarpum]